MRDVRNILATLLAIEPISLTNSRLLAFPTPTVTISNGVIVGTQDAVQQQDRFLAIPYAAPPTGSNRLRPPQPLVTNLGTITATASPSACPQFAMTIPHNVTLNPQSTTASSNVLNMLAVQPTAAVNPEDCLNLNVQRPAGTNSDSKLPVLVWTWGGGIENGAVSPQYDPNLWLSKAMSLGQPFVYVGPNYRLGGFGYLPGRQMAVEGATNIGLRDQRAVLEWVADNIAAFGGDPNRVTIFGNSGGALCVFDQTIINRGDNRYKGKPLFHGVLLASGSTLPALDNAHPKSQKVFDDVALAAGCDPNSSDVVDCLRNTEFQKFVDAQNSVRLDNAPINLSYFPRPDNTSDFFPTSPETAISRGEFVKVPMLTGNQQDEGAFWGIVLDQVNPNNDTQLIQLFHEMYPDAPVSALKSFIDAYPVDVTAGAPYNTGITDEAYPGYKRFNALFGDMIMIFARRRYLDDITGKVPKLWSYMSTYYGTLPLLGSCHSTDMLAIWNGLASPFPLDQLYTRFTSFIAHQDPNALNPPVGFTHWPQYDLVNRTMIQFNTLTTSFITDTFRPTAYEVYKAAYPDWKM